MLWNPFKSSLYFSVWALTYLPKFTLKNKIRQSNWTPVILDFISSLCQLICQKCDHWTLLKYLQKKGKKQKKKQTRKMTSTTRQWTIELHIHNTLKLSLCFTTTTCLIRHMLDFTESPPQLISSLLHLILLFSMNRYISSELFFT